MRIDTSVVQTVIFIGSATTGPFIPYGTGFLVLTRYAGLAFQALVTCKHVIDDIPGDTVHVRVNQKQGGAIVIRAHKADWLPHPDKKIDLMVCPTVLPFDQFLVKGLDLISPMALTEATLQAEQIGVGDEVSIVGMFVSRLGEYENIPIVRAGTIAAMPRETIETQYGHHNAYLVESRSIDGLSGSPVFVQLPKERSVDGRGLARSQRSLYLLGMMLGHHEVINAKDAITIKQKSGEHPSTENSVVARVLLNTGIGIVLPIVDIHHAVDQPVLLERRKAAVESKSAERIYVADSAHPSNVVEVPTAAPEQPAIEGDERHKERFTALLDEGVRKPTQGG